MAETTFFNDTLDNFTFPESQLLEQSCRRNILKAFNESTELNNSNELTHNALIKPFSEENITLDDSEFLNSVFALEDQPESSNQVEYVNRSKINVSSLTCTLKINSQPSSTKQANDETFVSLCTQEKCMISSWGLPLSIQQKYESRGISNMFKWQAECLSNKKLLEENGNLIYSAPTSAGKTLVAEIIAIKTVLERHKKVLIVLPFVSVVREKMFYFQNLLADSGVRVEGFMGSYNPPGGFPMVQVAICTIEKANGIINRCLEEGTLGDVGAVVVDEMHLLGDPSRGYLLELMLTKLQYMCARDPHLNIQIIGMSATLPNLGTLARWLNADLYTTTFRPIPLVEQYLVNSEIYSNSFQLERKLDVAAELDADSDHILQLCLETIGIGCSVLIFCPTKNWCENLAQQIACAFWKLGQKKDSASGECLKQELKREAIVEVLEQLKRSPVGLDAILNKTISFGVAFHHAGLTMDERDIIEGGFRSCTIRVLIATSTLSSGVNLPARRVIVRTPLFHGKPIDVLTYRQMIGRAGRMGRDSAGESILVCQKNDGRIVKELMSADLEPIESCLEGSGRLKRAILEVVASGVVSTPQEVQLFAECTLLAQSDDSSQLTNPIAEAVAFLQRNEFIRLQETEDGALTYVATSLAKACLSSSIPPEDGLVLFAELEKARQCFVLDNELHLIYLVTPYSCSNQWINLDWMHYLDMWEKLPAGMQKVGHLVGVQEAFIFNGTRGRHGANKQQHKLHIHKRFYTALALQELVNEAPLSSVAAKFACSRGMLQSLQQSASTFAGMITAFSRQLGWSNVELLISQFQDRLQFGVNRDLLDLMKLSLLDGPRARILHNAGIKSLIDLAAADVCALENVFYEALPFETGKERDGETETEAKKRNEVRTFWITGKQGLTEREAAELLIKESRRFLTLELGLAEAKWDTNTSTIKLSASSQEVSSTSTQTRNASDPHEENPDSKCVQSKIAVPKVKKVISFETSTPENLQKLSSKISPENGLSNLLKVLKDSAADCSPIYTKNVTENASNALKLDSPEIVKTELDESDKSGSLFDNENDNLLNSSLDISEQLQDLRLSKLDTRAAVPKQNGSKDCELYFSDESLFEKAFISGLEANVDCHKDDDSSLDSSFHLRYSEDSGSLEVFNDSNDLVLCSQDEKEFLTSAMESPFFARTGNCGSLEKCENFSNVDGIRKRERALNSSNGEQSFEETPKKKLRINFEKNNNASVIGDVENQTENFNSFNFANVNITRVCSNIKRYGQFQEDMLKCVEMSLALACRKYESNDRDKRIGNRICRSSVSNEKVHDFDVAFVDGNLQVVGVAFNCGNNETSYLSLENDGLIKRENKILFLKKLFCNEGLTLRMYGCKEHIKIIKKCLDSDVKCNVVDPRIADWMLNPEEPEKSFKSMIEHYLPKGAIVFETLGKCRRFGSIALDISSDKEPDVRAAHEATLTWHLVDKLKNRLEIQDPLLSKTLETEMRSILCLADLEMHGIGVNRTLMEGFINKLKDLSNSLEKEAYGIAGTRFSFNSSKEVAKVLGIYKGRKISTAKKTLETIEHPAAPLIVQWRKIHSILTKMMYPLMRAITADTARIYGSCVTHNATGRITMHEPNLQNVPRDFQLTSSNASHRICIRKAFVADAGRAFVSADYCQLELRLLSHFSGDAVLCSIMRSGEDVFRSVAAKWNAVAEHEVDDKMRQRAKQICYGIVYGMGTGTLAKHLGVDDAEAKRFIHRFKNAYPAISKFVAKTVAACKRDGYVATIEHRRRYLPHINDSKSGAQNQAERQAVNTTIQGSAADIAKKAMVAIEKRFREVYASPSEAKRRPHLVLHIHDELLYEVSEKDVLLSASTIKESMEAAKKLSVPLPVKVKCGDSWGDMKEVTFL